MASTDSMSVPAGLETLAPELVFKVMECLCPTDVTALLLASSHMRKIFNANQPALMISILKHQPGINNILYLHTAQRVENHPERMLHPRIVNVQYGGPSSQSQVNMMGRGVKVFRYLSDVPLVWRFNIFNLSMADVIEIWRKMKIIDRWTAILPRVIWRDNPEDRRCLRYAEEVRARKALSGWWLYSHHHHGFYHSWRSFQEPRMWDKDTRLNHIRRMTTEEILQLQNLWEIVRDVVSKDLCSSPERICRCEDGYVVDLVPWGEEDGRHERIVSTYMKLNPDRLLHYLDNYANLKRSTIMHTLTAGIRLFTRDIETMSVSMEKVLEERLLSRGLQSATFPKCSIVDVEEGDVVEWADDSCPDGNIPLTREEVDAIDQPIDQGASTSRGDDGSDAYLPH